jgi:hypothetical protein
MHSNEHTTSLEKLQKLADRKPRSKLLAQLESLPEHAIGAFIATLNRKQLRGLEQALERSNARKSAAIAELRSEQEHLHAERTALLAERDRLLIGWFGDPRPWSDTDPGP